MVGSCTYVEDIDFKYTAWVITKTYALNLTRGTMDAAEINILVEEARILSDNGETEDALDSFHEIIKLDPDNITAWYYIGMLYKNKGKIHEAIDALENVDRRYPNHHPTISILAILLEEIDLSKSIDYAKAGLINEPKNPELSRIANKSIEKVFIESVPIDGLDDRSSIDTIEDAESFSNSGDYKSAISVWKGLLDNSPNSPEIWRGLAQTLDSAGFNEKAIECRKKAEQLDSDYEIIEVQINQNEEEDDLLLINDNIVDNNNNNNNNSSEFGNDVNSIIEWYNKGINFTQEGNYDQAVTCFEKAIGGCPREEIEIRVNAHNGRGNALFLNSKYAESILAYHTAIELSPENVSGKTLYNMGSSYAALELFNDAVKCFSQSMILGLEKDEINNCEKQISRCRILLREQAKRQN